jgi:hypothetical protein
LTAQPAERISTVPSKNISTMYQAGRPAPAIHTPHNVGQSNNRIPIGLFKRVSCKYSNSRSARIIDLANMHAILLFLVSNHTEI